MYTRPLFCRRPVANYREIIKSRLKHWRKLANMSQAQAAKLAGVARSTWQTWEDPARGALPDLAALAAAASSRGLLWSGWSPSTERRRRRPLLRR